jgi:pyruvate,orthophosphate dikinase
MSELTGEDMSEEKTVCSLDYLIGTLATAYRGLITSLVLKNFCMLDKDGSTTLKGTILSIPGGSYQASLIHEGVELSRSDIHEGYFELSLESDLIEKAKNLQMDVLQNGKHIGTFLLKREKREGFFISALELSEEVRDIDFTLLAGRLRNKVGLLKKAEEIISEILSTKKDWKKFSEKINSFSKDLFWFDRESYYVWYEVLMRWSLKACERMDSRDLNKAVSNVMALVELPMEKEVDRQKLKFLVDKWLDNIKDSSINLSAGPADSGKAFSGIIQAFPEADVAPSLKLFIRSLGERLQNTPVLGDDLLNGIKDILPEDDFMLLSDYTEGRKNKLLGTMSNARIYVDKREYARIFEAVDAADTWLSKDRDMITFFFEVLERNLTKDSAEVLSLAFMKLFPTFISLPRDIYRRAIVNTIKLLHRLIDLKRPDICERVFAGIETDDTSLKTDVILDPEAASAVIDAGDVNLLEHYTGILKKISIPPPEISGFSHETWAEIKNPLHLERLSKFLDIIKLSAYFKEVLVKVICNLYVTGVFIPDDRIFQREISKYLNSDVIKDNFLLHYMLLKKLPVYYHEVGATGKLRDDTTAIDSWGNDIVLYFIRKQVHANASNHLIHVVEQVMASWTYNDPDFLKGSVPDDALKGVNAAMLERYSSVICPFFESLGILDNEGLHPEKIPAVAESEINNRLKQSDASDEVKTKIFLLCRIYAELVKKYSLITGDIGKDDIIPQITGLIDRLRYLREIIASPEKTRPEESLYFKRHIAFGIPSVMGSYHEPKFDALGETLRIEERIRALYDIINIDIRNKGKDCAPQDIKHWIYCLGTLNDLLDLHDLGNFQIGEVVTILKENKLHLSQITDLLGICRKEITWTVEFLERTFHKPLMKILKDFAGENLPEYLKVLNPEEASFINKASDVVMRALMNSITGFFELDRLLNAFIDALAAYIISKSDEQFSLSARPETRGEYFPLDRLSDNDAMRLSPLIGNKAKNLIYLHNKGLLVPYGVVFPADRTHDYETYTGSGSFLTILRNSVKEIEERTGKSFGGKRAPLFLSVRSGSYISMPGILSSILYCGMNEDTINAFTGNTGNPWLTWDSYRRFIEHYGTVVYDLDVKVFEMIMDNYMQEHGLQFKEDLTAEQLKEISRLYLRELESMDKRIPDDVYEQLREAVKAVYRSWYAERSVQFRKAMGVSEHWGTSVILMQMIYGNDRDSGASVFFTRKPFSLKRGIYGDTKEGVTGSELVYGRTVNRPLLRQQALSRQNSLEETDPDLFKMHEDLASRIEQAMRGLPQEVEATYTKRPDGERVIYVLQTRRMEFHRGFTRRFDDICRMESNIISRGVGVHGGALSGVATFSSSPELIRKLRKDINLPLILLRKEASTDDVSLMTEIDGIITSAGGATSHAAILAQKFNLTVIVGCSDMKIEADEKGGLSAKIGMADVKEGDPVSLDGSTGLVYSGSCSSILQSEPERV